MRAGIESQVRGQGVNECAEQQRYTGLTVVPLWPSCSESLTVEVFDKVSCAFAVLHVLTLRLDLPHLLPVMFL